MTTILTVLKTGRWHNGHFPCDYRVEHVQWLAKQFQRFAPGHDFACLSDVTVPGVTTLPLLHDWPGWWSKLELFREDFGKVLYVDLDTVVVGDLTDLLAYPHQFTAWCAPNRRHVFQSGIIAWSGPRPELFETFKQDPQHWIKSCTTSACWGDQGFIGQHLAGEWQEFGKLLPGAVGSYKLEFQQRTPPPSARIVLFHGKPRPWEVCGKHAFIPPFPAAPPHG